MNNEIFFYSSNNPFMNEYLRGTHIEVENGITTLYDNDTIVATFALAPGEYLRKGM